MQLYFRTMGVAQTKGSTRSWGFYAKNKSTGELLLNKHGKPILLTSTTNDNPKTKGWQALLAEAASHAIEALPADERGLLECGARLTIAFYFPRPAKYLTGKYTRPGAATPPHLTKPDASKCLRVVEDSLTKIAYRDDSQVVDLVVMKRYVAIVNGQPEPPHCDVWVEASAGIGLLPRDQPLFRDQSLFELAR